MHQLPQFTSKRKFHDIIKHSLDLLHIYRHQGTNYDYNYFYFANSGRVSFIGNNPLLKVKQLMKEKHYTVILNSFLIFKAHKSLQGLIRLKIRHVLSITYMICLNDFSW